MAKKPRLKISYVLDLPDDAPKVGHRLGVQALAVDRDNAILYSAGRDGIIAAWDLNLDLKAGRPYERRVGRPAEGASEPATTTTSGDATASGTKPAPEPTTTFRSQIEPHMGWVNDICLVQQNSAVVSASADHTVRVWRPHASAAADDGAPVAAKIGEHDDFAKCVAAPAHDPAAHWIASGGFDKRIFLWDLNTASKTLEIDTSGEKVREKGSVYALAVGRNVVAHGGPESIVRLWDSRSGERVKNFVGHGDMIRSILINDAADLILSASSDQTVKLWSVTAGRCMYTFSMHNSSVWSLYTEDPTLGQFYSADRDGVIAKTDIRSGLANVEEVDDGLSVAVAQETASIFKLVACGGSVWTATATSSINRWADVDMDADLQLPESGYRHQRSASVTTTTRPRQSSTSPIVNGNGNGTAAAAAGGGKGEIPSRSILRLGPSVVSIVGRDPEVGTISGASMRRESEAVVENAIHGVEPIHKVPDETIEGQFGLVKHLLLNDRRRVLTKDTAGDVMLWDLIKCEPIQMFGKLHLDEVLPKVDTYEAVAPWSTVELNSGSITVVLNPFSCFDAEMYADELELEEPVDFREDQRINLGKWILRYLFANLIDEEIRRDEAHRQKLNEPVEKREAASRANRPSSIALPPTSLSGWEASDSVTPRANGSQYAPMTPGLAIGLATPGPASVNLAGVLEGATTPLNLQDKRSSQVSRPSVDRDDYFSSAAINPVDSSSKPAGVPAIPAEPPAAAAEVKPTSGAAAENGKDKDKDKDKDANGKSPSTPFGKKFRMGMGMSLSKKLGRTASNSAEKPAVVDEKAEESESSSTHEKEVDDSFLGVVQRIRMEYDKQLSESPDKLVETRIAPSLANETPVLKLPPKTRILIQEETSGGNAALYMGTVESCGRDTDDIEQKAPMWLGEALLLNQIPPKDPVKVSFVLHPWRDLLPKIESTDGNNRLNANRMLRVKKILAYVAERIEKQEENPPADALRPEEYLELYCNDQLLSNTMSLWTLRTHVWKGGNDIVLHYKPNGRKEIVPISVPVASEGEAGQPAPAATATATAV